MALEHVNEEAKARLKETFETLNPFVHKKNIEGKLNLSSSLGRLP
jgi:hypothetical protein